MSTGSSWDAALRISSWQCPLPWHLLFYYPPLVEMPRLQSVVLSVKALLPDSCWFLTPYLTSSCSSSQPPSRNRGCIFVASLGADESCLVIQGMFSIPVLLSADSASPPSSSLFAGSFSLALLRAVESAHKTPGFTPKFFPVSFQHDLLPSFISLFLRWSPAVSLH